MAQKSGFFNSLLSGGEYDRPIDADDIRLLISALASNGVRRSYLNDLRVSAAGGMSLSIGAGFAVINGAYYVNDAAFNNFTVPTAPAGDYARIDRIVIRLDDAVAVRSAELVYLQGVPAAAPVAPELNRGGGIYEIALADITVRPMTEEITQADILDQRDNSEVCGWITPPIGYADLIAKIDNDINEWFAEKRDTIASVTLFKRYTWSTTLTAAASAVTFEIPQYEAGSTSQIWVFVNGNIEIEGSDFVLDGSTIRFATLKEAGTEITVFCLKSIDGTGLGSVADEVTELQNKMATVEGVAAYSYNCTGTDDNITLSQIAQAFLNNGYVAEDCTAAAVEFLEKFGGNAALAKFGDRAQVTIRVFGKCGITTPYSGNGTATSRYKWFSLGRESSGEKRVIFDFGGSDLIYIPMLGNTSNILFYGTDLYIKNAHIQASCYSSGCEVSAVEGRYNTGKICLENCDIKIITTAKVNIAKNGDFINCNSNISSSDNHALAFMPASNCLIRINGGRHLAYCAGTANTSAIIYIYSTETNAAVVADSICCPTVARDGFRQTQLAVCYAGKTVINSAITTLPIDGTYATNVNQIAYNKV